DRSFDLNVSAPGPIGKRRGNAWLERQWRAYRGQPDVWNVGINHSDRRIGSGCRPAERTVERAVRREGKATRWRGGGGVALAIETVGIVAERKVDQQIVRAVIREWPGKGEDDPATRCENLIRLIHSCPAGGLPCRRLSVVAQR